MKAKNILSFLLVTVMVFLVFPQLKPFSSDANAASTVQITYAGQVIDTFNGVSAIYRTGISDGSDTTYSCAAFVKKYYNSVYGVDVWNLLTGKTPIAGSGSFSQTSSPESGDIGYQTNSKGSGHWFIIKSVSGSTYTIIEQNWKWQSGSAYYCTKERQVSTSTSGFKAFRWSGKTNPGPSQDPIDIANGVYVIQSVAEPGRALDIQSDSNEVNANIQLYDKTGSDVQKFRIIKDGSSYVIQNVYSGYWLDTALPANTDGCNIKLYNDNTALEEHWQFFDAGNGNVYIRQMYEMYIDTAGGSTANNANVQVSHFTGSSTQQWKLIKLDEAFPHPTVLGASTGLVTKDTFRVCLSLGTDAPIDHVAAAIWTDFDQDDLHWYDCYNNGANTFFYDTPFSDFNEGAHFYICHFYVYLPDGTNFFADSVTYELQKPTVKNTYIGEKSKDSFQVCMSLDVTSPIDHVAVVIWSDGNQDDMKWYDCENNGANTYYYYAKFSDQREGANYYTCHFYVFQPNGDYYLADDITYYKDKTPPVISNVRAVAKADGYTITCTVTDDVGVTNVSFPTWTSYNGQDDIIWHEGTINGNTASCWIPRSDHNNESGIYYTHIYAYDLMGNSCSSGGIEGGIKVGEATGFDVNFILDGKSNTTDCSAYGTFDVYMDGSLAANDVADFANLYYYGTTYEIKDIKTKTGHTYKGVENGALSGTIGNDGIDLRLKFDTNSSTLTVDPNGGVWNGSTAKQNFKQNYNTTKSVPVPTREGYTFSGWKRSGTNGTMSTLTAAATYTYGATNNATDTITAQWTCTHSKYHSAITTPATCTAAGVKTFTCATCGHSYTEAIPATGVHTDADKDNKCDGCGKTMLAVTAQPKSVTVTAGTNATFSVTAAGEGLSYAWYYKDPGNAAFSKSASVNSSVIYTTSAERNGRQVYCVVTDKYGNSVQSNTVTLTVICPAKITAQPKSATVTAGTNAAFSVTAAGEGLSYAWYFKDPGSAAFSKSASVNSSVIYTTSAERNGRQVYCVVTDKYGNAVKSNTVTLTVVPSVKLTSQPANRTVSSGVLAEFTVAASGEGLTYVWYYKDPGQSSFSKSASTTDTVTYKTPMDRNGRQIYCVVTDQYGNSVKSDTVTLTVVPSPKLTSQPADRTVSSGVLAEFTVTASGEGLTYAWYYKDPGQSSFTKSASTTDTVTYKTPMDRNGRQIYCVVTDKYGNAVKSDTVTLTVQ